MVTSRAVMGERENSITGELEIFPETEFIFDSSEQEAYCQFVRAYALSDEEA